MSDLERLAAFSHARTAIDEEIAALLGRPAERGHAGESIAAAIFDIRLHPSATHKGHDGVFASGPGAGRSVNVKWYGRQESMLDINPDASCDDYVVMTGPWGYATGSQRAAARAWVISAVHLFDGPVLLEHLAQRGVKIGVASSVGAALWRQAEIYPTATSPASARDTRAEGAVGPLCSPQRARRLCHSPSSFRFAP